MLVLAATVLRCRPAEPGLGPTGGEGPGLRAEVGLEPVVGLSAEWLGQTQIGLKS